MRILSQTNDIKGYHGTIGTPTNMYDYRGERLFVGDVVCLVTFDSEFRVYKVKDHSQLAIGEKI